jgi:predicted MFS family arabinose efflux permease
MGKHDDNHAPENFVTTTVQAEAYDGAQLSGAPPSIDQHDEFPQARWSAVAAIALGVFSFVTTEFLPVGILPQIAVDLHVSLATAGLMLTAPGLLAAVSAPAIPLFAGSINRRHLLLALTSLLLVADLMCGLAPTFPIVLLGRALFGVGLGGFWAVALAVGGRLAPKRSRARAISLIVAGITVATIVGLPIGSMIGSQYGWRASFWVAAGFAALAIISLSVALPSLNTVQKVRRANFHGLLADRQVRSALGLVLCLFGGNLAAYTYLAPYLRVRAGLGVASVPIILLLFGITSFAANFLMPIPLARYPRITVAAQAIAMIIALAGLSLSAAHLPFTIVLLLIWAIPFGAVPLCLNHWVQGATTAAPEAGSALFVGTVQVAIALGSASGAMAVRMVGLPANFWLGATLSIVGAVIVARRRTSR